MFLMISCSTATILSSGELLLVEVVVRRFRLELVLAYPPRLYWELCLRSLFQFNFISIVHFFLYKVRHLVRDYERDWVRRRINSFRSRINSFMSKYRSVTNFHYQYLLILWMKIGPMLIMLFQDNKHIENDKSA